MNQLVLLQRQVAELQAENERLRQLAVGKDMLLHERGVPQLCAVIDALRNVARGAAAGDPTAAAILRNWNEAVTAAAPAGRIAVVGNGQPT